MREPGGGRDGPNEGGGSLRAGQLRDLLAAVMHDNADGILVIDPSGEVLAANAAASALLGTPSMVGQPFGLPVVAGESAELEVATADGVRIVELRAAATSLDGAAAYVATLRDVTRRKQVERSLQDFVSMTSHEFRTPLTAITGFARTLLQTWDHTDDETKRKQLAIILRQGTRLSRLCHDLLSISQLDQDAVQPLTELVDVASVVEEVLMILDDELADAELDLSGLDTVASSVDPDHLQEILLNLVTNAVKYGRPPIAISAASTDDDRVEVRVRDHGDGVPEDMRPRLFKRYERSQERRHRSEEGTGLGLAIVAGLAERNHGEVRYEDPGDGGACFVVVLPEGGE